MAQRPYVFVNMAMTADGKIDTVARRGARISGPADTMRVDRLRASSDAILVGGRTLTAEDPRLTVRDDGLVAARVAEGRPAQPTKVGLLSRIAGSGPDAIPLDGRFVREGGGRVVVFTTARAEPDAVARLEQAGVTVRVAGDERVDLLHAIDALSGMGIERLMVEGGSTTVAALLAAGLVDELQLAIAPLIFGGASAPTPVGGPGRAANEALALQLVETSTSADGDVIVRYLTEGTDR